MDPEIVLKASNEANPEAKSKFLQNLYECALKCCSPVSVPNTENEYNLCCNTLKDLEKYIISDEILSLSSASSTLCGKIFKNKEPIYSCWDCATDATCVLCRECFINSEHRRHNYELHNSSGGTCDCGDPEAWKGYHSCQLHSASNDQSELCYDVEIDIDKETESLPPLIKSKILSLAKVIFTTFKETVIYPLFKDNLSERLDLINKENDYCKKCSLNFKCNTYALVLYNNEIHNFDQVINLFKTCLRITEEQAMTFANLVDRDGRCMVMSSSNTEEVYKKQDSIKEKSIQKTGTELLSNVHQPDFMAIQSFILYWIQWFYDFIDRYPKLRKIVVYNILIGDVQVDKEHFPKLTFVEDVINNFNDMWKYSRKVCTNFFMTAIFKEPYFKKAFATCLIERYEFVIKQYSEDDHNQEDSLVSLSCQLFTVMSLAKYLVEKHGLLQKLIKIINTALIDRSVPLPDHNDVLQLNKEESLFRKFDPFDRTLRTFSDIRFILWSILSSLSDENCDTSDVVIKPMTNELMNNYIDFLSKFIESFSLIQDTNTIERVTTYHVEHDPQWKTGIMLMYEMMECITINAKLAVTSESCWSSALDIVRRAFVKRVVEIWEKKRIMFTFFNYSNTVIDSDWPNVYISVVKPLHRFMAALLTKQKYRDLLTDIEVDCLCDQALQIVVFSSQQMANMWVRCGTAPLVMNQHIRNTVLFAETYYRDLQLLQEMACQLTPEHFLLKCIHKFNLKEYFYETIGVVSETKALLQCAEDFVTLIILTLFHRHRIGVGLNITEDDVSKYIILNILCIKQMPHSKIMKKLSFSLHRPSRNKVMKVLDEVSDQTKSGQMLLFSPKKESFQKLYDKYCPYFSVQDRNDAEINIQNLLRKQGQSSFLEPREPIELSDEFKSLYNMISSSCLTEIIDRYLYICSTRKNGELWNDGILDAVLYLLSQCLLEDLKFIKSNSKERVLFVNVSSHYGLKVDLLARLESLCDKMTVHQHLQLIKWIIRKWYEIRNKLNNTSMVMETDADEVQSQEVDEMNFSHVAKANAAKRRRQNLMNKMLSMQKKFIEKNMPVWNETNTIEGETSENKPGSMVIGSSDAVVTLKSTVTSIVPTEELICILCQEREEGKTQDRPIVAIAGAWLSTVLTDTEKRRNLPESEILWDNNLITIENSDDSSSQSGSKFANERDMKIFPKLSHLQNVFITTCGHVMHNDCKSKYLNGMIKEKQTLARTKGIIHPRIHNRCPLCKCVCNIDIPVQIYDNTPQPSEIKLSMSYEEWLNLFSEWKPIYKVKKSQTWASSFKNVMFQSITKLAELSKTALLPNVINASNEDLLVNLPYKINLATKIQPSRMKKELYNTFEKLSSGIYMSSSEELIELSQAVSYTVQVWEKIYNKERQNFMYNMSKRHRDGLYYLIQATCRIHQVLSNQEEVCIKFQEYFEILQRLLLNTGAFNWSDIYFNNVPIFILEVDFFNVFSSLVFLRYFLESNNQENKEDMSSNISDFLNKPTYNLYAVRLVFEFVSIQTLLSLSSSNIDEDCETICQRLQEEAPDIWNEVSIRRLHEMREILINGYSAMKHVAVDLSPAQIAVGYIQTLLSFLRSSSFLLTVLGSIEMLQTISNDPYMEFCNLLRLMNLNLIGCNIETETVPVRVRPLCDKLLIDPNDNENIELLSKSFYQMPFTSPRLIDLPLDFTDVVTLCLKKKCSINPQSSSTVFELAICLLCGDTVCLNGYCCRRQEDSQSSHLNSGAQIHARIYHGGYSLYLSINSSRVIVMFFHARWYLSFNPVYLDKFGECDPDLKRGNPLFLNQEAYHKLEKEWMEHKLGTIVQDGYYNQDFFI